MDLSKIDTIVLSSGGVKGICYIGFFKYLFQHIDPIQIKHYIGTSAGCIMSLLLVLGYNLDEITKILFKYDMNNIIPSIDIFDFKDILLEQLGFSDGNGIKIFIEDIINYKFENKTDITFLELFESTNIKFTVVVTNFSQYKVEYWNHETNPSIKIVDAILATSRIPPMFTPLKVNDDLYLDGAIINSYPIDIIPMSEIDRVIGCCLSTNKDIGKYNNLLKIDETYDKLIGYFLQVIALIIYNKNLSLNEKYVERTITFEVEVNVFDGTLSNECKQQLLDKSYDITDQFFKSKLVMDLDEETINSVS
jgi:predicted acylesterase/phospholipase RssA